MLPSILTTINGCTVLGGAVLYGMWLAGRILAGPPVPPRPTDKPGR